MDGQAGPEDQDWVGGGERVHYLRVEIPKAAPPGVGFFTSRMMLAEGESLETLEDEIGKPVVTSHSATLWSVLNQAGVTEPVYGYGRLLAEPRIDLRKNATSVA